MKKKIREIIRDLLKLNNTPHDIALGVAIGVFIAVMPLYGLHTVLVVVAAFLVRRANVIAILVGTNISLPPTVPLITWTAYDIGRFILHNGYPPLSWSYFKNISFQKLWDFYAPLFIGSIFLGFCLAVAFYFITLVVVENFKKRKRNKADSDLKAIKDIQQDVLIKESVPVLVRPPEIADTAVEEPRKEMIVIANDILEIPRLKSFWLGFSKNSNLSGKVINEVSISLEKVVNNIIYYGYEDIKGHRIIVSLWFKDKYLFIEVSDDARAFNLLDQLKCSADIPEIEKDSGAKGISIVRKLMDEVEYRRQKDRNILLMKKLI